MKITFGILLGISFITLVGLLLGFYFAYKTTNQKLVLGALAAIILIALVGFGLSLKTTYTAHKQMYTITQLRHQLIGKQHMIDAINKKLPRQLLFIHHSVGSGWLDQGGLGEQLIAHGIGVHDATYGDAIGNDTDMKHWVPKFENHMTDIIRFNHHPNVFYDDDRENDIIMFKSCFPNSNITGQGESPGNPTDPTLTTANFKATFAGLMEEFAKQQDKTFIYITAPPLVPSATSVENARRARECNDWVKSEFLKEYRSKTDLDNFLVFDFFDVLADENNYLKKEYRISDTDSHPSSDGTRVATGLFIGFLKTHGILTDEE